MRGLLAAVQLMNWVASFAAPLVLLCDDIEVSGTAKGNSSVRISVWSRLAHVQQRHIPGGLCEHSLRLAGSAVLVRLGWRCRGAEWLGGQRPVLHADRIPGRNSGRGQLINRRFTAELAWYDVVQNGVYLVTGVGLTLAWQCFAVCCPCLGTPCPPDVAACGLLAVLPFVGVLASVALVSPYDVDYFALETGMLPIFIMLPLFFLTSLCSALHRHRACKPRAARAGRPPCGSAGGVLSGLAAAGDSVRRLRHDLRNHLTVIRGSA